MQALAQDQLRALRQMCSAAFGDDAPHVEVYDGDTSQVSSSSCQTINTVTHAGKPPGGTAPDAVIYKTPPKPCVFQSLMAPAGDGSKLYLWVACRPTEVRPETEPSC